MILADIRTWRNWKGNSLNGLDGGIPRSSSPWRHSVQILSQLKPPLLLLSNMKNEKEYTGSTHRQRGDEGLDEGATALIAGGLSNPMRISSIVCLFFTEIAEGIHWIWNTE
jgi:hypothetical protein